MLSKPAPSVSGAVFPEPGPLAGKLLPQFSARQLQDSVRQARGFHQTDPSFRQTGPIRLHCNPDALLTAPWVQMSEKVALFI